MVANQLICLHANLESRDVIFDVVMVIRVLTNGWVVHWVRVETPNVREVHEPLNCWQKSLKYVQKQGQLHIFERYVGNNEFVLTVSYFRPKYIKWSINYISSDIFE